MGRFEKDTAISYWIIKKTQIKKAPFQGRFFNLTTIGQSIIRIRA